jgi:hypothetical protein
MLVLSAVALACRESSRRDTTASAVHRDRTPTTVAATAAAPVTYRGADFVLELPLGSRIGHGSDVDTLVGPLVTEAGRSPDLGGPGPHPTFEIEISVAQNPRRVPLAMWTDSLYRRDTAAAEDFAKPGPVEHDALGAEPALRLERFCGDCEAHTIYAARGERVVSLAYEKGIHLAGTREQQEAAFRHVFRTFRWGA